MSWLGKLIGESAGEVIESVGEVADKFITTDAERDEWIVKKNEVLLKFKQLQFEAERAYIEDRQNARDMYKNDSSLQKLFAIIFLVGYLLLTMGIVYVMFDDTLPDMTDWQVALISSVFTAMSTKVNTIVDFLFGGSKTKDDSEKRMVDAFTQKATRINKETK